MPYRHILCIFSFIYLLTGSARSQSSENVNLDQKIGQMLKIGFRGLEISDDNHIIRDIREYNLGGVVLFDYDVPADTAVRNIRSPEQTKKLVRDLQGLADTPLFVMIDQEGGRVARLKPKFGFPPSVSAQYLGSLNKADTTRKYARRTAQTLNELGINVNLAPVVDVNTNPDNPVIGGLERSFSSDPNVVTRQAKIYIETLHDYGILTTLKHFPGHGSSEADSHLGIADVTKTWNEKELIPYEKLISSGTADFVMTAHIFNAKLDSTYPATLSRPIITGILRDSLNFKGVVISDDMQMKAIRSHYGLEKAIEMAIKAGVDILSFANNSVYVEDIVPRAHGIIKKLVENGTITTERIDQSYRRIMKLKQRIHPKDNSGEF